MSDVGFDSAAFHGVCMPTKKDPGHVRAGICTLENQPELDSGQEAASKSSGATIRVEVHVKLLGIRQESRESSFVSGKV